MKRGTLKEALEILDLVHAGMIDSDQSEYYLMGEHLENLKDNAKEDKLSFKETMDLVEASLSEVSVAANEALKDIKRLRHGR